MTSPPLYSTHGQTTSGVACHHCLWTAHTVERRRGCHAIIAFGLHKQSNNVGRGMPSMPLVSTNGRTTSTVACQHCLWTSSHSRTASGMACHHRLLKKTGLNDVGRGMPSLPLGRTHGRTTLGVACHHRPWTANTVKRRHARHAIIAIGLADIVGRRRE